MLYIYIYILSYIVICGVSKCVYMGKDLKGPWRNLHLTGLVVENVSQTMKKMKRILESVESVETEGAEQCKAELFLAKFLPRFEKKNNEHKTADHEVTLLLMWRLMEIHVQINRYCTTYCERM